MILRNVTVQADSISFLVDSDIVVDGKNVGYSVFIGRQELLAWLSENAGKNVDDFILTKIQAQYALILKVSGKAQTLVGKTVTW